MRTDLPAIVWPPASVIRRGTRFTSNGAHAQFAAQRVVLERRGRREHDERVDDVGEHAGGHAGHHTALRMAEQRYLQRVVGVTHMVQDRDGVFDLVEYVGVLERAFAAAAAVEVEPHACHAMRGESIADVLIEFAWFDTHVAQEPVQDRKSVV